MWPLCTSRDAFGAPYLRVTPCNRALANRPSPCSLLLFIPSSSSLFLACQARTDRTHLEFEGKTRTDRNFVRFSNEKLFVVVSLWLVLDLSEELGFEKNEPAPVSRRGQNVDRDKTRWRVPRGPIFANPRGGKSAEIEISRFISLPKPEYQSTSPASGRKIED